MEAIKPYVIEPLDSYNTDGVFFSEKAVEPIQYSNDEPLFNLVAEPQESFNQNSSLTSDTANQIENEREQQDQTSVIVPISLFKSTPHCEIITQTAQPSVIQITPDECVAGPKINKCSALQTLKPSKSTGINLDHCVVSSVKKPISVTCEASKIFSSRTDSSKVHLSSVSYNQIDLTQRSPETTLKNDNQIDLTQRSSESTRKNDNQIDLTQRSSESTLKNDNQFDLAQRSAESTLNDNQIVLTQRSSTVKKYILIQKPRFPIKPLGLNTCFPREPIAAVVPPVHSAPCNVSILRFQPQIIKTTSKMVQLQNLSTVSSVSKISSDTNACNLLGHEAETKTSSLVTLLPKHTGNATHATPATEMKKIAKPSRDLRPHATPATEMKKIAKPSTDLRPHATLATEIKKIAKRSIELRPHATPATEIEKITKPSTDATPHAGPRTIKEILFPGNKRIAERSDEITPDAVAAKKQKIAKPNQAKPTVKDVPSIDADKKPIIVNVYSGISSTVVAGAGPVTHFLSANPSVSHCTENDIQIISDDCMKLKSSALPQKGRPSKGCDNSMKNSQQQLDDQAKKVPGIRSNDTNPSTLNKLLSSGSVSSNNWGVTEDRRLIVKIGEELHCNICVFRCHKSETEKAESHLENIHRIKCCCCDYTAWSKIIMCEHYNNEHGAELDPVAYFQRTFPLSVDCYCSSGKTSTVGTHDGGATCKSVKLSFFNTQQKEASGSEAKKKKRATYMTVDNINLLDEVLIVRPFGAEDNQGAWTTIADNVTQAARPGFEINHRSARDHFHMLLKYHRSDEREKLKKSGNEEEFDTLTQLLTEAGELERSLNQLHSQNLKERKGKGKADRAIGHEIRDVAMVSLKGKKRVISPGPKDDAICEQTGSVAISEASPGDIQVYPQTCDPVNPLKNIFRETSDKTAEYDRHSFDKRQKARKTCCACSAVFRSKKMYDKHLKILHPNILHTKQHDDLKEHKCAICGKTFTTRSARMMHGAACELSNHQEGSIAIEKLVWTCPFCGRHLSRRAKLRRHLLNSHRVDPLVHLKPMRLSQLSENVTNPNTLPAGRVKIVPLEKMMDHRCTADMLQADYGITPKKLKSTLEAQSRLIRKQKNSKGLDSVCFIKLPHKGNPRIYAELPELPVVMNPVGVPIKPDLAEVGYSDGVTFKCSCCPSKFSHLTDGKIHLIEKHASTNKQLEKYHLVHIEARRNHIRSRVFVCLEPECVFYSKFVEFFEYHTTCTVDIMKAFGGLHHIPAPVKRKRKRHFHVTIDPKAAAPVC